MTTKAITIFALIALCALSAEAKKVAGNGNIITKEVSVNEYDAISFGSSIVGERISLFDLFTQRGDKSYTFYYKQAGTASLEITIDENLYPHLKISSQNGKLSISTQDHIELAPTSLKVTGTSKGLKKVHISGHMSFSLQSELSGDELEIISSAGSDISLQQPVRLKNCTISASAGGDIELSDLECQTISCDASGGSDINLAGKASDAQYTASGGSDIKATDFIVSRLKCSASGGSDIYTHVTDHIQASASGGSDIHYKGSATSDTSASGGSDIYKDN